ncbi:MAG: ADP-dependent glucokinase/phosphofructokinase [Lachnospiraceae bacterium]
MRERFALGFHTCVDYELEWDTHVVEDRIKAFDIHEEELRMDINLESERAIWIAALAYLRAGIGCELIPDISETCVDFANRFKYKITLGGTPTRAAIILDRLGYPSVLQTSCYNEYVERLIPKGVRVLPGTEADHTDIYPHVVLQCLAGVRIHANDIDFTTPRENRILISRDVDSLNMAVLDKEFGTMIRECEVFLLGSFTEILDLDILKNRIEKTKALLSYLPKDATVVMEDGCYINKEFRHYVHQQLASKINVLSMNEDELQQYIGKTIDILDPKAVKEAVEYVHKNTGIQLILIHSASWAIIYGEQAVSMRVSLEGGVTMAATRFRIGDEFTVEDYAQTKEISAKEEGIRFCESLEKMLGNSVYCIPCKDLSYVKTPTVVGLGDSFAGGLLPGLLKENKV